MEEPSQFSLGQTAHSLIGFIVDKPHTGLDDSLNMLLECFRKRMSGDRRRINQVMVTELTAEIPDRQNFRLHREFCLKPLLYQEQKFGSDNCTHFPKLKFSLKTKTAQLLTSVGLAWVSGP